MNEQQSYKVLFSVVLLLFYLLPLANKLEGFAKDIANSRVIQEVSVALLFCVT